MCKYFILNIRSRLIHLHDFQLFVKLGQLIKITFCTNRIIIIIAKGCLDLPNLILLIKQKSFANKTKESITSQRLGCLDFWHIANSVLNKSKSPIPPLINGPDLHLIKCNCLLNSFPRTLILTTQIISLPAFLSMANLKQHISGIPKLVKKLITNLDSSKTHSPDCIPVMVLKKLSLNFFMDYLSSSICV